MLKAPVFRFGNIHFFPVFLQHRGINLIPANGCIFLSDRVLRKIFYDLKLEVSTAHMQHLWCSNLFLSPAVAVELIGILLAFLYETLLASSSIASWNIGWGDHHNTQVQLTQLEGLAQPRCSGTPAIFHNDWCMGIILRVSTDVWDI